MASGFLLTRLVTGVALVSATTTTAQTLLTLEEASRRIPASFAAAHAGEHVTVQGTVSGPKVRILEHSHIAITDDRGFGFTLEWDGEPKTALEPGDVVRATGIIAQRFGLPLLRPDSVQKSGRALPPEPVPLTTSDLNEFRNLGRYVEMEAVVFSSSQNAAGDILLTSERSATVAIFLPRKPGDNGGLRQFRSGDKVRVRGISSQYCPIPPYDRGFQVVVQNQASVAVARRAWVIAGDMMLYALIALAAIFGIWWIRERQAAAHRRVMRRMMALSEELLTASSAVDVARRLESALPPLLNPALVALYVFNRGAKTLERVATEMHPDRYSIDVDEPMGTLAAAAALCFRNRALLEIPNVRKSPLINTEFEPSNPHGALFVPLFAKSEPVGVLAIHYKRAVHRLSVDERTAMQHLGNLIAAALRLQEQRWMRDQLLRSEKMAAAGQLVSGVANDLREPLSIISEVARQALQSGAPSRPALQEIERSARHGVEIVQHLLAFSRMDRSEPRPLDVFGLVSSIVEMRRVECAAKGIQVESGLPVSALQVVGDPAQLEQVFLSLLLHAELFATASESPQIMAVGRLIGKRVVIGISYSVASNGPRQSISAGSEVFDPRVCHALIQGHAGELRLSEDGGVHKAEVDLPVYLPTTIGFEDTPPPARRAARFLTALVVETDDQLRRSVISFLSRREHRVVPVDTYDAGLEAAQRFRFDVVICADRIGSTSWVDFFQRVRRKTGAFVLVTEVEQVDTGPAFKSGEAFVLHKPLDESELDNVLRMVESDEPARK
jgi:signal transduction histidine kinase